MSNQNLEPAAEDLLRSGKRNTDHMSDLPALYSIAISLKRIADSLEQPKVDIDIYNRTTEFIVNLENNK